MQRTTPNDPITSPTSPSERPSHQVGLDAEEAALARASLAVAASASAPDRLPWAVVAAGFALLSVLALGAFAQAKFADSLTFLKGPRAVPTPLYAADWYEPPRTLDQIMVSIHAERGR